jgi:hypothetical protein
MLDISRRHLMSQAAGLSLAAATGVGVPALAEESRQDSKNVTKTLAHYIVTAS